MIDLVIKFLLIALLVLMNQCGLPLPIKKASLCVFRNIFVDIGDDQSIELSLSGFSSHMKNVSHILNNIDSHSLVIMDELGSKTDPSEGEALAKAIIEYINDSKATNVNSCWYALQSMKTKTILILGGKDKGNDYTEIADLVKEKCWFIVEKCDKKSNKEIFYFFPYKFNYNTNNLLIGLFVPINDPYSCGIFEKTFPLKDFIYNDSKWTKVSEKKVLTYIKNHIKDVIDYRMNKINDN